MFDRSLRGTGTRTAVTSMAIHALDHPARLYKNVAFAGRVNPPNLGLIYGCNLVHDVW